MPIDKPFVLVVSGMDPTAGAGILADVKTAENNNVYALGACTAITYQNDVEFADVRWLSPDEIIHQIEIISKRFHFEWVKIGIIEELGALSKVIEILNERIPDVKIVWDPIIMSTTGFIFHNRVEKKQFEAMCKNVYLITPNLPEMRRLMPDWGEVEAAKYLSKHCHVLLKGGHDSGAKVKDLLFKNGKYEVFTNDRLMGMDKHGSGCVLSTAITANLANGDSLSEACIKAKAYIEKYMQTTEELIGYHIVSDHD